jgi:hypothetical protein
MSQKQSNRNEPIRPKQIQMIHIAKGQLGLDDDTYRDVLHGMFGVASSKELTAVQADELLDEFNARGFTISSRQPRPSRRPKGRNVVHLASQAEIDKLNAVAALIRWQYADGLQRFLERRLGIKEGKVRTAREAYLAIEALKKMFEGGMVKAHGPQWWLTQLDDPEPRLYIRKHCPAEYHDALVCRLKERGLY